MSGMTGNKTVLIGALIAAVLSMAMAIVIQNVRILKADVPRGCRGNPHEGGHHSHCPGNK
jgi:hypothetical protein